MSKDTGYTNVIRRVLPGGRLRFAYRWWSHPELKQFIGKQVMVSHKQGDKHISARTLAGITIAWEIQNEQPDLEEKEWMKHVGYNVKT